MEVPKKTHNVEKLFLESLTFDGNLNNVINPDFIEFLSKAYNLRYFDNDVFHSNKKDFKLSVAQFKTLAELDKTALTLLNSWNMQYQGNELESEYHTHLKEANPLLFNKNYVLNKIDKKDIVEQNQLVYEIGTQHNGILELNFQSESVYDDGNFTFSNNVQ